MVSSESQNTAPYYRPSSLTSSKTSINTLKMMTILMVMMMMVVGLGHTHPGGFYVSNGTHILLVDGENEAQVMHVDERSIFVSIAVDLYKDSLIFWSDVSYYRRGIYKAFINTTGHIMLPTKLQLFPEAAEVYGIVADVISNNLYWTDARHRTVEVYSYGHDHRRTLIFLDLKSPRGIHLDIRNGFLFWNDQDRKHIERSRLDGSNRTVIVRDAHMPNHMIFHDDRLYWVNSDEKTLDSCKFDGSDRKVIVNLSSDVSGSHIFGLAISTTTTTTTTSSSSGGGGSSKSIIINNFKKEILITSWKKGSIFTVTLEKVNGNDVVVAKTTKSGLSSWRLYGAVAVYDGEIELLVQNSTNPCWKSTCDEMCFNVDDKAQCLCNSYGGLVRSGDKCVEPENILLFAMGQEGYIGFIAQSNNNANIQLNSDVYFVAKTKRPVAITYDPLNQKVYWSDVIDHAIYRADLDGKNFGKLIDRYRGVGVVDGLAYDPSSSLLFYTNIGSTKVNEVTYSWHKVEVIQPNDISRRRTIISTGDKLRALAVDSVNNYIYYTDWGTPGSITRTDLTGANTTVLRSGLDNPNGLSIVGGFIYYIDSHYKSGGKRRAALYRMSVHGTRHETIQGLILQVPFGLTVDRNQNIFYISDWDNNTIIATVSPPSSSSPPPSSSSSSPSSLLAPPPSTSAVLGGVEYIMGVHYTPVRSNDEPDEGIVKCAKTCKGVCMKKSRNITECFFTTTKTDLFIDQQPTNNDFPSLSSFIAVSDMSSIKVVSLDDKFDNTTTTTYTLIQGDVLTTDITALAFYGRNTTLFYYDAAILSINSYNLLTNKVQPYYALAHVINSMLIHDDVLYWLNPKHGILCSISLLSPSSRHSVLVQGLDKPQSLKVYNRELYWIETGHNPRVAKVKAVDTGLTTQQIRTPEVVLPTCTGGKVTRSSTIYLDNGHLYLTRGSKENMQLFKCSLGGFSSIEIPVGIEQAFDIFIFDDYLFYTDPLKGTFNLSPLDNSNGPTRVLMEGLMRPTEILVNYQRRPMSNECRPDDKASQCPNGICTPLMGTLASCTCPRGLLYNPNKLCIDPSSPAHQCLFNNKAVPYGDIINPTPCKSCKCIGRGQTLGDSDRMEGFVCSQLKCPDLTCPEDKVKIVSGQCCPVCEDECTSLKFVKCPQETSLSLPVDQNYTVDESSPSVVDCTGLLRNINLTRIPSGRVIQWEKEKIGQVVPVKYVATVFNPLGQLDQIECDYGVILKDVTPPTLVCPNDVKVQTFEDQVRYIYWSPPKVTENTGDYSITSTHQWGIPFSLGTHVVTYVVTDSSNNQGSCSFTVTVEKVRGSPSSSSLLSAPASSPSSEGECHLKSSCSLPTIVNGYLSCSCASKQVSCVVVCDSGHTFNNKLATTNYSCSNDNTWNPKFSNEVEKISCIKLVAKMLTYTQPIVVNGQCQQHYDTEYTVLHLGQYYKRRVQYEVIDKNMPQFEPIIKVHSCKNVGQVGEPANQGNLTINLQLQSRATSDKRDTTESLMKRVMDEILSDIDRGFMDVVVLPSQNSPLQSVFDFKHGDETTTSLCSRGEIPFDDDCMLCPPGMYWNVPHSNKPECSMCPYSTFNPEEGRDYCIPCKGGTTSKEGSIFDYQCHPIISPSSTPHDNNNNNRYLMIGILGGIVVILLLIVVVIFGVRRCYRTGKYSFKNKQRERNGRLYDYETDHSDHSDHLHVNQGNGNASKDYQRFDYEYEANRQHLMT